MKKMMGILFMCAMAFQSLEALLPPLYQTADEIKSILSSKILDQKLTSGEAIMTIQKNKNGYEIITNRQRVQVDVVYESTGKPGPANFKIIFHEPIKASI